jgi:hypothetical protein
MIVIERYFWQNPQSLFPVGYNVNILTGLFSFDELQDNSGICVFCHADRSGGDAR